MGERGKSFISLLICDCNSCPHLAESVGADVSILEARYGDFTFVVAIRDWTDSAKSPLLLSEQEKYLKRSLLKILSDIRMVILNIKYQLTLTLIRIIDFWKCNFWVSLTFKRYILINQFAWNISPICIQNVIRFSYKERKVLLIFSPSPTCFAWGLTGLMILCWVRAEPGKAPGSPVLAPSPAKLSDLLGSGR